MTGRNIVRSINCVGVVVMLLTCATVADAQDREGRWEFSIGTAYQLSNDLDFEGGSTVSTDNDFNLGMTGGYHFSDKLATTFGFQWSSIGYDANVIKDDDTTSRISGSYENWNLFFNGIYHFSDGPVTPYVGAGIGWNWIDTGVPSGLPSTGCWWDPWWGYVCYTSYPTHSTDAFSYQATVGIRYEFNYSTFARLGYTSQWIDLSNATSTPRFDVFTLEIGWMF